MTNEPCKHAQVSEKSRTSSGPITSVIQRCVGCDAERVRTIVSLKIPGITLLSDSEGPWSGEKAKA